MRERPRQPLTKSVTAEGRTIQEAIDKAIGLLGVSRDRVQIRVLAEESTGLFGMRGAKPAKVRATLKQEF